MNVYYELRNRPDKEGNCPLRIVFSTPGKRTYKASGLKVPSKFWDAKRQEVKAAYPQSTILNAALHKRIAEIRAEEFAGNNPEGRASEITFKKFAIECLGKWEKYKAENTMRNYTSLLNNIMIFDSAVTLEEINPQWLRNLEKWHRNKNTGPAAIIKQMALIQNVINVAIREEIIEKNPFLAYQIPAYRPPDKTWLSAEEVQKIKNASYPTQSLRDISIWFLFSCFTGLRYSDVEVLNFGKQITEGRLILATKKTKETVSIKINRHIQEIIDMWPSQKILSNRAANEGLKKIATIAGIDKHISFHTARHTFAVQCANLGISQEVTAKLLGLGCLMGGCALR